MPETLFSTDTAPILDRLAKREFENKAWYDLREAAERLTLTRGFERLLSLDDLPLQLYDHQRRAVLRVLRDMRGRAVLADEVGLGKTIEAGVVLREYCVRGLARRVLILVPAQLVEQWRAELEVNLRLEFRPATGVAHWERYERIIASLDTAKRDPHAAKIAQIPWDMVIVDEAHRLKNRRSINWQFVNGLQKKYILLLTATPVQNDLEELYNLVTLLMPGQLHTFSRFRREFTLDRHSPKNVQHLRKLLDDVMVRTARRETLLRFPRRDVRTLLVAMTDDERVYYSGLLTILRESYARTPHNERNLLPYIMLLRLATSHARGSAQTLAAMFRRGTLKHVAGERVADLVDNARRIEPSKFAVLRKALQESGMHAIVFTSFRETARQLSNHLAARGQPAVIQFHGGLNAAQKEAAIKSFREQRGILISTEAGSEGMNLQFCSTVINYDLPWNPLRLEQRIGRVHRLGQTNDVRVYNMATEGTVEAYIIYLLEKKIDMFNKVVGELESILTNVDGEFQARVALSVLSAADEAQAAQAVETFGSELSQASDLYDAQKRLVDSLFASLADDRAETTGGLYNRG